ncbi:MAG TPA: response regulator [Mariprofundaceae bacterium]|nr:response regulator [Mariprofundaceae bacterium]
MAGKGRNQVQRILLVDDDPMVRAVLRESLQAFGYAVVAAENGRKAIDIFQRMRSSISLLITDIRMPEMDGVALIRRIRAIDPELPIVVITAHADEAELAETEQQRTALFVKPLRFTDLEALLRLIGER